MGNMEA
jgi:hypothetical protein